MKHLAIWDVLHLDTSNSNGRAAAVSQVCQTLVEADGISLNRLKVKVKVVYGQEPPSGESTTTECGFNYQLLAVITEVA